jgi:uncharacterized protein (TIGR02145 family)
MNTKFFFRIGSSIILLSILISCSTTGQIRSADGTVYPTKLLANNLWMTTNLKLDLPDSYCYNNTNENCEKYGRLYTWESAKEGCKTLGNGWHLPTSTEWRQIALLYKGTAQDSSAIRKAAYKELLLGGSSGLNAVLGGGRELDGKYARMEAHGFYWTSTELTAAPHGTIILPKARKPYISRMVVIRRRHIQ